MQSPTSYLSYLHGRVRRLHENTAGSLAGAFSTAEKDVSGHTPAASPGVLHLPVLRAVELAVSNNKNTMIKLGSASGRVHNSTGVELENRPVGFDSDRHRLPGNGLHHGVFAIRSDVRVSRDSDSGFAGAGLASATDSLVSVRRFFAETLGLSVFETVVHQTTVASHVAVGSSAINELLLGKGNKVSSGNGVGAFNGASGGESPAGAALSLVLHGSDNALRRPVNGGRELNRAESLLLVFGADVRAFDVSVALHDGTELFVGHVSEFVQSDGDRGVLGVVFPDELDVLLEGHVALPERFPSVGLVVLFVPLKKLEHVVRFIVERHSDGDAGEQKGSGGSVHATLGSSGN
mmetsp:Transcript_3334/g.6407  ORF Transcript_3334/g.6407 Transcript_3334/m.6407 type:complete len:349 (-) Transcript_3334:21-1067(-)